VAITSCDSKPIRWECVPTFLISPKPTWASKRPKDA
jgi:hypothetical protein